MGMLIVSQPNTPGHSPIPFTRLEAQKVKAQLSSQDIQTLPRSELSFSTKVTLVLNDKDSTVAQVSEALERFTCVHFACHAFQDVIDPLKSAIYLYDRPLELSAIVKKKLPYADLAFLSACQTFTGVSDLSEEAVHLAAGMLAAGYKSVVATMWSIPDNYGPLVAETFYKSLIDNIENTQDEKLNGTSAAYALHNTIQSLKSNSEIQKLSDPLLVWVPYIHVGI